MLAQTVTGMPSSVPLGSAWEIAVPGTAWFVSVAGDDRDGTVRAAAQRLSLERVAEALR